jgi:hypothetical protein
MASLEVDQLRQIKELPWQRLHSSKLGDNVLIMRENMFYPPEVAHMINTKFGPRLYKNDNVITKSLGWVNDQWRKSVLTRPLRLARETVENGTAYLMLGGGIRNLVTAPLELLSASKFVDWAYEAEKAKGALGVAKQIGKRPTQLAVRAVDKVSRGLTKGISTATFMPKDKYQDLARVMLNSQFLESMGTVDNIPRFKTSIKEAQSLDANMFQQMEMLHDTAKTGRKGAMKELLGYDESTLKRAMKGFNPAKWIEGINDSGLARFTRAFFGGTSSNITKYALAKTYIDKGFDPITAMARADKELVSFRNLGEGLQNARWVSPFASYNMRSLMRLPAIFASSPAGPTFFNKVQQGFENYSGWNPQDQIAFSHFIGSRFMPSPIVGPLLRGTKELEQDPEYFGQLTSDIAKAVYGEDGDSETSGSVMVMNFPDVWKQGINFMNPEDFMNNVGPLFKAAMVFLGRDPYTNKELPYHGTDGSTLEMTEKFVKAFEVANPVAFNDLYNFADAAKTRLQDQFVKHLVNFGMDEKNADYIYKKLYPENDIKIKKSLDKALRTSIKWNTFGFGSLTNTRLQATYKQVGLMKSLDKLVKDTEIFKGPRGEIDDSLINTLTRDARRIANDIVYNAELLNSYEAGIEGALPALSNEEKIIDGFKSQDPAVQAIEGKSETVLEIEAEEAALKAAEEGEAPAESVDAQEYLEGDQSSYAPDDGRSPAMARGAPREGGEIIQTGSHMTQDYMASESDPYALTPEERATLEEQQKVMGGGDAPAMTHEELVYQELLRLGISPGDAKLIIEESVKDENDLIERGPASHRAVELGSGGAPGGGTGGGIGAAIGAGAAAPFIQDKAPPKEEMGMGSGMSEEERRLYLMSPSQLAQQPDSAAKQRVKDIKSMENPSRNYKMSAVPSRSHLPGYEEIVVEGDVLDNHSQLNKINKAYRDNYWARLDRIERRKDNYIAEGMSDSDAEALASKEVHEEDKKKFGKEITGVKAWARGFAPNPDTFLITEVQRNPKDKKATEEEALDKAIEYARKAGYKNIGIADAESVAQMQGHSGVKDWVSRRYDRNYLKHMGKKLQQSPTDKEWELKKEAVLEPDEENEARIAVFKDKFKLSFNDVMGIFYNYKGSEPDEAMKRRGITKEDLQDLLISREYTKRPMTQKVKYKLYSLEIGDKKKDEAQYLKDIGALMKAGMSQEEAEVYAEKMFKNKKGDKK